jgi:signal transduction histidine kinase
MPMPKKNNNNKSNVLGQATLDVFKTIPDPYLIFSPEYIILTASNKYLQETGSNIFHLQGKNIFEEIMGPITKNNFITLANLKQSLQKVIKSKKEDMMPIQRFDHATNSLDRKPFLRYWSPVNTPVLDNNDNILYIIHKITDVTDKYLAKEQHKHDETIFEQMELLSDIGYYQWDLLSNELVFSEGLYRILGYEPSTFSPSMDFIDSISNSDDAKRIKMIFEQAKIDKKPFSYSRQIYGPDGKIIQLFSRGSIFCNDENEPIKLVGVVQDVTRHIRADMILDTVNEVCFEINNTFIIKYANKRAFDSWGKKPQDALEKSIADVLPTSKNTSFFNILSKALLEKINIVEEIRQPGSNKWMLINANPSPTGLIVTCFDITSHVKARKQVKEQSIQLRKNQTLIQSIFNTTLIQLSVLKAIRNKNGDIIDFEIMIVNKELEKETNRTDLIGKLYSHEYPGIKKTPLYNMMLNVMESGKPEQIEYYYPFEGFNKWYSCMFVKIDNGLVASNLDITQRKNEELEKYKNFRTLRQAEELTQMGSWGYEVNNRTLNWSDGMYSIFNLSNETNVTPEIYYDFVTGNSRSAAKRLIKIIKHGKQEFEEEIDILVNGQVKHLIIKATPIYDIKNVLQRVIGVNMDITNKKQTELKLKQSEENRYKEIINVQEIERRRIAETLHNELGQLLSIAKMKLPAVYTESADLLNRAIIKSRKLSYELMTPILEDFGLEFAINDMFEKKLTDAGINYLVNIKGLKQRITDVMEVAVYRILQELLNNIIKHSKANMVKLDLEKNNINILIKLTDNGIGINKKRINNGFGINYINNRVHLLKGKIILKSNLKSGSQFYIELPLIT